MDLLGREWEPEGDIGQEASKGCLDPCLPLLSPGRLQSSWEAWQAVLEAFDPNQRRSAEDYDSQTAVKDR